MKHTPLEPFAEVESQDLSEEFKATAPVGELYEYAMLEKPMADLNPALQNDPRDRIPEDDAAALAEDQKSPYPGS